MDLSSAEKKRKGLALTILIFFNSDDNESKIILLIREIYLSVHGKTILLAIDLVDCDCLSQILE